MSDEKQVTVVSSHRPHYGECILGVVDGDEDAAERWAQEYAARYPDARRTFTFEAFTISPAPPDTVTFEVTLNVEHAEALGPDYWPAAVARAARAALDAREDRGD